MYVKLISAIPAEPGHFLSTKQISAWNEPEWPWSEWAPILAWGFSEQGETIPLTLKGAPDTLDDWRIKTPDGKVV